MRAPSPSSGTTLLAGTLFFFLTCSLFAQESPDQSGLFAQRTSSMQSQDGFIPLHYDEASGQLFLEVTRLHDAFIYSNALAQGMGSEQPRLDRASLEYTGREAVVWFERHGPRVLLVAENTRFRALTDDEAERRVVEESFPSAVYAAFPIEVEEGDRFLVDATEFFLSDLFDVAGRIRDAGEGEVRIDRDRSHISHPRSRAFPKNTEVRAVVSYVTDDPGPTLRRHAPDGPLHGRVITLQQHHTFAQLPPPGFQPRAFDPRVGLRHTDFRDYAQSFDGDYREHLVWRWRLEKEHPDQEISEPVEPIVFYMDPGIPEPYRTAYFEGVEWWNRILESAGFRNAVQVRDLPDDADPMDIRYSMIVAVHRTEPGLSTGPQIKDPRTGEILHAIVRQDSHRSLVNYNYYMGLLPALHATDSPIPMDAEEVAMLRRRQHIAHEVGHALGFEHNFIAESLERNSVMDYPAPVVRLDDEGRLDISQIYRDRGGAHDTLLVRYTYTEFASPEAEAEGLEALVADALDQGLLMLAGQDAALQAAHPAVHQWVQGTNMIEALERAISVREVLLEHFNEEAVRPGEPMAFLNERLAHVYLHHRYALEAATKYVGGMEYTYALRGDGQDVTRILPGAEQRRALALVLSALHPEALAVPERVSALIAPTPYGYDHEERWILSPTGVVFDPLALARALSTEIVDGLLHPERAARVVSFRARDPDSLSLHEVISGLLEATWENSASTDEMEATLLQITQRAVVDGILDLAASPEAPAEVRSVAHHHLVDLTRRLEHDQEREREEDTAHRQLVRQDIERFLATGNLPELRTGVIPVSLPWP